MEITPIKNEVHYRAALKSIEALMNASIDTPEGDRLDVLVTLVEAYEAKHYRVDVPDPVEAIKYKMGQAGLTVKDLVPMIGQTNRVYEVLAHTRPLTLAMIRKLHRHLNIPAESLIREPMSASKSRKATVKLKASRFIKVKATATSGTRKVAKASKLTKRAGRSNLTDLSH